MSRDHLIGGLLAIEGTLTMKDLQHAIDVAQSEGRPLIDVIRRLELADESSLARVEVRANEIADSAEMPRVLIVDDEESIRLSLEEMLADAGYECVLVSDVEAARDAWSTSHFDVALIDKNLGDRSGLELTAEFQHSRGGCQLALMSGYANLSSAVEAIQHSVADYILKPFDTTDLLARVQRLAAIAAIRRQADSRLELLETYHLGLRAALEKARAGDSDGAAELLSDLLG